MKKTYTAPAATVIAFEAADIITVSVQAEGKGLSATWVEGK